MSRHGKLLAFIVNSIGSRKIGTTLAGDTLWIRSNWLLTALKGRAGGQAPVARGTHNLTFPVEKGPPTMKKKQRGVAGQTLKGPGARWFREFQEARERSRDVPSSEKLNQDFEDIVAVCSDNPTQENERELALDQLLSRLYGNLSYRVFMSVLKALGKS